MAQTATEICNLALGRIGVRQFINDLQNQKTTEAATARVFYEPARDTVLASFPWQFATGRAVLALTALERTNWLYVYTLPADCLAARYLVVEGVQEPRPDQRAPYGLENDETVGKVLLTDLEAAELVYTRALEDVNLFPPLFVEALAWKLAADFALGIPIKPQLAASIQQGYSRAVAMAATQDFRQSQQGPEPQASYIRARGGGGRGNSNCGW